MHNQFWIADPHFDHYNIAIHCHRWPWISVNKNYDPSMPKHIRRNWPFVVDIEAHNEELAENWNGMVGRGDLVYILGDFAFKNHMRHLARLHGKKILITGNHDKMNQDCLRNFTEVHEWGCMRNICLGITNNKGGLKSVLMCMTHCASAVWPSSHWGSWHLYGHSHGRFPEWQSRLAFDVGVDIWDYRPAPLEAIIAKMDDKIKAIGAANAQPGDGERQAFGKTPGNAEERMLFIRKENLDILRRVGIEPKYPADLKAPVQIQEPDDGITEDDC